MVNVFTWIDYVLFLLLLAVSALVGVYYGFLKKQNTASDYLLGGKQMSIWPIATSIISSSLSGLALISFPADIYRYGITLFMMIPHMILVMLTAYYITLPVFYKLQVTSVFEYLNERFDNKVQVFSSILYTIHQALSIPISVYVPALALSQVTGVSVYFITPIICGVCIFYTTLGGMKGIVLADAIQFIVMLGTLVIAVVTGIWFLNGFSPILETASKGGRLNLSFELTLLKRDTFWSALALFTLMLNHYSINQGFIQKCMTLPSYESIKTTIILSTLGIMLIKCFCMFMGLVIYTQYYNCDPVKAHKIKNYDQLVPMYIMENINFIPGFAGLFLSGVFSASLSTLSAGINSLAATIYKDFILFFISKNTSQSRESFYLKILAVLIGIFSTACVFIIEKLGSLVGLAFSLSGITSGPLLGLFFVGMLIPKVNAKGALYGGIISLIIMTLVITTAQWYKYIGIGRHSMLPVSTDSCNANIINDTISNMVTTIANGNNTTEQEPLAIFLISFYFYNVIGTLIVIGISLVISYYTTSDKPLNKDCISPVMHFLLKNEQKSMNMYESIDMSLKTINKD